MKSLLFLAAISLSLITLLAVCGDGSEESPTDSSRTTEVKAQDFSFQPAQLTLKTGSEVKVTVRNQGRVDHTFTIDELNVDKVLKPGEEATVSLTPNKTGQLRFYCRFHQPQMAGTLFVGAGGAQEPPTTPTIGSGGAIGY